MRCVVGEVLYDFPSPNYGTIDHGFAYTESLIRKWQCDPLISIAVEPHSLFTCSPDLLLRANELALSHQVPLILHVAETLRMWPRFRNATAGDLSITWRPWVFWAPT